MRQTGDYEDFIDFSKDDVNELIIPAEILVKEIGIILEM